MLLSHRPHASETAATHARERLRQSDSLNLPLDETLAMVDALEAFELGRYLLANKGLNGYWTAYVILYGKDKEGLSNMEDWLLNRAPSLLATRERFGIFQKEILKHLQPGMHVASLPCGLMEDFLGLSPEKLQALEITGIDLDEDALKEAAEIASSRGIDHCRFLNRDAWDLQLSEAFHLMASNGLNIYEPDAARLVALYREMARALRPRGVLITSYLAHPDDPALPKPQITVNPQDARMQKALFMDIIQPKWQCFQTEASVREQLQAAGFTVESIVYDARCLFPMVVARKGA